MGLGGLIPNVVVGDNNQCHSVAGERGFFSSTIFSLRGWRDDNILERERILDSSIVKEPVRLTDDVRQRNQ